MTASHPDLPRPDDIARLAAGRVLVVGDVMLDHYVSGEVSRVSEEAPVPIIRVSGERWTLGGASNVAANIASLGGHAILVGVVGADAAGRTLDELASGQSAVILSRLIEDEQRPTTIKTRYMGGQHQMVRVDRESVQPVAPELETLILRTLTEALPDCRVLVLSDYAKGVLTDRVLAEAIRSAKAAGVRTVVDPKRRDWSAYSGADLITPNRRELAAATGLPCSTDADCELAARRAMEITGSDILLTRSEKGASLYSTNGPAIHVAADAREVFDVSGAGDTVVACFALCLAAGQSANLALRLANIAAGVVVAKRGTATASPGELRAWLLSHERGAAPLSASLEAARALREQWRREGLSVGFTNGCFDLIHPGHIHLLSQAAAACDRLIVGLNTDASVRTLKGPTRPIQSEAARAEVIGAIRGVDAVVLFGEQTPIDLIEALTPDVLIKGADYEEKDIVGADFVKARGGRIVRAELIKGQSTTRIVGAMGKPETDA
jgi:D-beta-D-heptose 7-phosphate kinase/D-beta-D-heptose 1-phosphate adenosyltransferase